MCASFQGSYRRRAVAEPNTMRTSCDAVRVRDEAFQIALQVQQHQFGIELESERIAEGCLEHEATQIVRVLRNRQSTIGGRDRGPLVHPVEVTTSSCP